MIVKCLVENTTNNNNNVIAEHGLSLYIETDKHKILFDTGQSDVFYQNAIALNVNLNDVDIAILSHGHYDHGGGLKKFMEINKYAAVFVNKYAFEPHYHGPDKYIGLDKSISNSDRIIFIDNDIRLDETITILSSNRTKKFYADSFGLQTLEGDKLIPDDFRHEQYLMIKDGNRNILISGCSHNGILNIMDWFHPQILIGGFHFTKINPDTNTGKEYLLSAAKILNTFETQYYTCHCTGLQQYKFLKTYLNDKLRYLHTGDTINFINN